MCPPEEGSGEKTEAMDSGTDIVCVKNQIHTLPEGLIDQTIWKIPGIHNTKEPFLQISYFPLPISPQESVRN